MPPTSFASVPMAAILPRISSFKIYLQFCYEIRTKKSLGCEHFVSFPYFIVVSSPRFSRDFGKRVARAASTFGISHQDAAFNKCGDVSNAVSVNNKPLSFI